MAPGARRAQTQVGGTVPPIAVPTRRAVRDNVPVNVEHERMTVGQLEAELRRYETRYKGASARLVDAFTVDGELQETEDFRDWSLLYAACRAAVGQQAESL